MSSRNAPGYDYSSDARRTKTVKLRGLVTSGLGKAAGFTELPWVKRQFVDKLDIDACPGTFNIKVLCDDLEKLSKIRMTKGIEIKPPDALACGGKAFFALISGRVRGAAVIPLVAHYPRLQLEIVSACNIRQTLGLKDGDLVEVEVNLTEASQE